MKPNYHKIYSDILEIKYPEKIKECGIILSKENLKVLDIIEINRIIFGCTDADTELFNQRLKSYKREDIIEILNYQRNHKLSNNKLALHFKISRNTLIKWKKIFFRLDL